jgi:hypothetical protein
VRRHHVTLQVALPGSRLPSPEALQKIAPDKMIELHLVPDRGPATTRWHAPPRTLQGTPSGAERRFADYAPKTSADTLLDYRGDLKARLDSLPPARLDSLPALLNALRWQKNLARRHPGRTEKGNPILGADEEQYVPSDEELLESEIGRRIAAVLKGADPADLKKAGIKGKISYRHIDFRHVDVMGSGRFFYTSAPRTVTIQPVR